MPFIFYDTETTGTDPAFDQVLQVAAILADNDLNELDSFNLRCRLQPHVLPSITALLITGMTIGAVDAAPLSYGEMVREMRRRFLAWSADGAVFCGWNTLSFDEEMLRQGFYQTLHPLYLTNTGGNTRADLMRMAQAIHAVRPQAINRGVGPDGKLNWKLGDTAAANGIVLTDAHDALADTRATLEIARALKANAPNLFAHMIQMASKAKAMELAETSDLLFLAESRFGSSSGAVVAPLALIGSSSLYTMFDLRHDPAPFLAADDAALQKLLNASPRPVRKAPLNKQPAIFPVAWTPEDIAGGRLPLEIYQSRAAALRADPALATRIARLLESGFDDSEPTHVEQQIYRGFPSSADTRLMTAFHEAPWDQRAAILQRLEDPRARTLGLRHLAAERENVLDVNARTRWAQFLRDRLLATGDVPWRTMAALHDEIAELREADAVSHAGVVAELREWIAVRTARLTAISF